MLEFKDVVYRYEGEDFNIIDGLSFTLERGSFASVVGVSGCGKSTIFKLINRLLPAKSGEILVAGKDIHGQKNYAGYMPQRDLLFPWRTVEGNVCLPMELRGVPKEEQALRADQVLKDAGLAAYKKKYPKELSGGMRQRAAFGRTLLTDSDLLLLDEPFSALDSLTRLAMQEWLLDQWTRLNKTILFITHDVEEAIFLSKTVFVIAETPIRSLVREEVPLPYPRDRSCLDRPEIVALKDRLLSALRRQVTGI